MAYAPLPQLADLFLPCDGLLEPPCEGTACARCSCPRPTP
ncbi:hypothetical protein QEG98_15460 [Myxococcus sp. MxC21-1]|nr:hypothetical protein QEG98_15460 [Myxococcus sp. MxC21-1]